MIFYVWDYSENESVSRGHNGKVITPGNSNGPAYYGPYNKNKTGLTTVVTTVEVLI